jgi:membrane protein
MRKARLTLMASSLAYATLLSIIPALAVSFALFKAFGGMDRLYDAIAPVVVDYLAQGAGREATHTIQKFIGGVNARAVGLTGFVGLVVTTMSLMSGAEKAINEVWRTPLSRPIFQRMASYWLFITIGPLASSVALGLATSKELRWTGFLPHGSLGFGITVLFFYMVYKWVPNRNVHWLPAVSAALLTASIWTLARLLYGLYTRVVVIPHTVYGSLGAIPILLVWLYISWLVILGGAAFSAALQKRVDAR